MLYTTLLVAATAFLSFAVAQNDSSSLPPGIQPCCTVPANDVPTDLKDAWCKAQRNTCPEICGGINQLATGGQSCDSDSLEFKCSCRNGTTPDMAQYQQSVPGQMCRFWFDQCINATNQNLEQQVSCQNQRDTKCGNLTTDAGESSSSASAGPTASATGSGGGNAASATAASPSSASSGAATALAIAREYGTPVLAGGMLAIFGLVL